MGLAGVQVLVGRGNKYGRSFITNLKAKPRNNGGSHNASIILTINAAKRLDACPERTRCTFVEVESIKIASSWRFFAFPSLAPLQNCSQCITGTCSHLPALIGDIVAVELTTNKHISLNELSSS